MKSLFENSDLLKMVGKKIPHHEFMLMHPGVEQDKVLNKERESPRFNPQFPKPRGSSTKNSQGPKSHKKDGSGVEWAEKTKVKPLSIFQRMPKR